MKKFSPEFTPAANGFLKVTQGHHLPIFCSDFRVKTEPEKERKFRINNNLTVKAKTLDFIFQTNKAHFMILKPSPHSPTKCTNF
jgi:hypothetical protein